MGWALPACGGRDRFAINARKKIFNCRRCAVGGDTIAMVEHVTGSSFVEAVKFITGEAAANMGEDVEYHRGDLRGEAAVEPNRDAFVAKRIAAIVRELVPVRRSPGGLYFREARAIDTESIADILERTDAIGWHPSVLFREEGHPLDGERLGCIVGVMTDRVTARPTGAISRTYLHGGLKLGKAKTLGSPVGIVRLSADEDVLGGLHIAEGLETRSAPCRSALDHVGDGRRVSWRSSRSSPASRRSPSSPTTMRAAQAYERRTRSRPVGAPPAGETHVYLREVLGDFNDALLETGR